MIVSLSSAKSDAEQEEAKRCFHEVIASYPDVTIRGFKPADQSVAVLFEMENLAVGKIVPDIEGKDAQNADLKLSNYRGKVVLLIFLGRLVPFLPSFFTHPEGSPHAFGS
jgi:hypothetical protein